MNLPEQPTHNLQFVSQLELCNSFCIFHFCFQHDLGEQQRKEGNEIHEHAREKYQAYIINFMPEISRWIIFCAPVAVAVVARRSCQKKWQNSLLENFIYFFSVILFSVISCDQRFKARYEFGEVM